MTLATLPLLPPHDAVCPALPAPPRPGSRRPTCAACLPRCFATLAPPLRCSTWTVSSSCSAGGRQRDTVDADAG